MKESLCNENLRKIRRAKDYTQEYVAFELNISQKAYSEIEQGKTKMKHWQKIERLSPKALKLLYFQ